MKYTVDAIPPSNNRFIGKNERWAYSEAKKEWQALISVFCRPRPPAPLKKAIVKITYHFKDNVRRDPDNYSGKFILDGLVRTGIIADDSFECVTLLLGKGENDKNNPHTDIEIIPVE